MNRLMLSKQKVSTERFIKEDGGKNRGSSPVDVNTASEL